MGSGALGDTGGRSRQRDRSYPVGAAHSSAATRIACCIWSAISWVPPSREPSRQHLTYAAEIPTTVSGSVHFRRRGRCRRLSSGGSSPDSWRRHARPPAPPQREPILKHVGRTLSTPSRVSDSSGDIYGPTGVRRCRDCVPRYRRHCRLESFTDRGLVTDSRCAMSAADAGSSPDENHRFVGRGTRGSCVATLASVAGVTAVTPEASPGEAACEQPTRQDHGDVRVLLESVACHAPHLLRRTLSCQVYPGFAVITRLMVVAGRPSAIPPRATDSSTATTTSPMAAELVDASNRGSRRRAAR